MCDGNTAMQNGYEKGTLAEPFEDHTGRVIEAGQRVEIDGGHSDDWEAVIINKDGELWWSCIDDGDQVKITKENCSSIEIIE